jgi:endonuclease/exonuclease/phosphatase family metal-dependent hydrolase
MPSYADLVRDGQLAKADEPARTRAVTTLLKLREALRAATPTRSPETLLLGTWNLREFDSESWGYRLPEAYAYMAEVIDRFDLVAIQEVRSDLRALEQLRDRLGLHWNYLVSDVTEGSAGNRERLAFLYDTTKVRFLGIAGELVLPPVKQGGALVPAVQVARTPLMATFQVGWTKFVLATVHILYGEDSAEPAARVDEIREVARFLRARTEDPVEPIRNLILLGDFNIFTTGDATMRALTEDGGFSVPDGVKQIPGTNVSRDKKYDQIAFRSAGGHFQATGRAGAFDYYEHLFDDPGIYRPYIDAYIDARRQAGEDSPKPPEDAAAARRQFNLWRTYQMSDHLPLWAEFRVDFADEYLTELVA